MGFWRRVRNAFLGSPRVEASYDAARDGHNVQHWQHTDNYDANSANSKHVRDTITKRSRYEINNNGYGKGVQLTQANYVVGRGPRLRMQTRRPSFNKRVEQEWHRWCKATLFARKLRTAVKAKVSDGEGILMAVNNPNLKHPVKLDIRGIETEQMTSPLLGMSEENKLDGITFDAYGNAESYQVLPHHPGGEWGHLNQVPVNVPAKFVFHLFREDRPGQHRAVPETTSTLNLFGNARRSRESVLAAQENIANFSIMLKSMQTPDDGADIIRPLSTMPIEKGMMVTLPEGWDGFQPKAEQPGSTYDAFARSLICEEARPLNMPYNIAAADSSGYSFSGGRLDHLTYFVSVDVEQSDIEDITIDPMFALWFEEAKRVFGWFYNGVPEHDWNWPAQPQIDPVKTANARRTNLGNGSTTLRQEFANDGWDYEDKLAEMAEDYGISVDDMRKRLLEINLPLKQAASTPDDDEPDEDDEDEGRGASRVSGYAFNGNGRH